MAIIQVQSRLSSRLLKGRTLTATFTDDILALYRVSPETLHLLYSLALYRVSPETLHLLYSLALYRVSPETLHLLYSHIQISHYIL